MLYNSSKATKRFLSPKWKKIPAQFQESYSSKELTGEEQVWIMRGPLQLLKSDSTTENPAQRLMLKDRRYRNTSSRPDAVSLQLRCRDSKNTLSKQGNRFHLRKLLSKRTFRRLGWIVGLHRSTWIRAWRTLWAKIPICQLFESSRPWLMLPSFFVLFFSENWGIKTMTVASMNYTRKAWIHRVFIVRPTPSFSCDVQSTYGAYFME